MIPQDLGSDIGVVFNPIGQVRSIEPDHYEPLFAFADPPPCLQQHLSTFASEIPAHKEHTGFVN